MPRLTAILQLMGRLKSWFSPKTFKEKAMPTVIFDKQMLENGVSMRGPDLPNVVAEIFFIVFW